MDPWTKISEERTASPRRRQVLSRRFLQPNGKEAEYEIKDEASTVCVLAVTPDHRVVLARQFRPGPEGVLLELPGGVVEPDEDLAVAADRELKEETGYAGLAELVGSYVDCAYTNRRRTVFLARDCRKVAEPSLDEQEFVEVVLLTLLEFRAHIRSGKITDGFGAYLALDRLGVLR